MALDRQTIEKRDFPIGRRGYEPEAVDAHLARIAEDVEQLRRSAGGGPSTPASIAHSASEQVRSIVEAAETSAMEIERAAQMEAEQIRDEAEADAARTRDEATRESQEQISKVREATTQMLQRVEAMQNELSGLVESLRTGGNRITADLSLLEGGLADLSAAVGTRRAAPARAAAPAPAAPAPAVGPPSVLEPAVVAEPVTAASEPFDVDDDNGEVAIAAASSASGGGGDVEGARLVALNMALNGTARDETDRYLRENFDLADRDGLLDEVYATVES